MIVGKYRGNFDMILNRGQDYYLDITTANDSIIITVIGIKSISYDNLESVVQDWMVPVKQNEIRNNRIPVRLKNSHQIVAYI